MQNTEYRTPNFPETRELLRDNRELQQQSPQWSCIGHVLQTAGLHSTDKIITFVASFISCK